MSKVIKKLSILFAIVLSGTISVQGGGGGGGGGCLFIKIKNPYVLFNFIFAFLLNANTRI